MTDWVGQQIGNYRLTRLLGEGSFAQVYLGLHIHLQSEAAIKLLRAEKATAGEIERFRLEASTIARLHHPHIVRVLDFDIASGVLFFVMEYASNGSLRTRHPKGTRLPPEVVLAYMKPAAEALQYAHEQRVVHRDVKPENMLVGAKGQVLLSDFGIATIAHTSRSLQTGEIAGTLTYMAPEQIRGKPRPASDQYALGIVMYEWLTGAAPFQGGFDSIARQHLQDQPPPLRAWNASISPLVEEVVLTTLAKDPKDRFATMSALAAAFERACYPYGPAKLPPSLPGTPPTPPANAGGAFPTPPNRMPVASPTPIPLGINTPATPTPTPVYTPTPAPTPAITPPVPLITPTTPPVLSTPPPSTGHKRLAPGIRVLLACLVVVLLAGGSITALGLAGKGPLAFLGSSPVATPTRLPFGTITEFNTPSFGGHATGITAGPDGNLWFTEIDGNRIGRITPAGAITEFPLPKPNSGPDGITKGMDGNLWFVERDGNRIGRITPAGSLTEFPLNPNSGPVGITVGQDGNLWFTEAQSNRIGRITLAGAVNEANLPTLDSKPDEIVSAPDGTLWFTEIGANKIAHLIPAGAISEFPNLLSDSFTEFSVITPNSAPDGIALGPGGTIWFTEYFGSRIGQILPNGQVTELAPPTPKSEPVRIVLGPDGNLWFTEASGDRVGRLGLDGHFIEFEVPTASSNPDGIAEGADGNLWFTEYYSNKIARISASDK